MTAPRKAREVLRIAEIERPEPGPGEVRVRVYLSGVNPTDWKSRAARVPAPDRWLPNPAP